MWSKRGGNLSEMKWKLREVKAKFTCNERKTIVFWALLLPNRCLLRYFHAEHTRLEGQKWSDKAVQSRLSPHGSCFGNVLRKSHYAKGRSRAQDRGEQKDIGEVVDTNYR